MSLAERFPKNEAHSIAAVRRLDFKPLAWKSAEIPPRHSGDVTAALDGRVIKTAFRYTGEPAKVST